MIAMHKKGASLRNFLCIRAYQFEETSQDLYLVASLTIPLTLPPCMALSQRRMVWCLRDEKKDSVLSKRDFSCKSNLSYCYRVVWMKRVAIKNHVCILCVERTGSTSLLALTAFLLLCLSYTSLITTPLTAVTLVPLLCSHISNPTFLCPLCLLHLCNPLLSSLSLLYLLLPPFPLLLTLPSLLTSLPTALLFSTFEASLVSASSNKL